MSNCTIEVAHEKILEMIGILQTACNIAPYEMGIIHDTINEIAEIYEISTVSIMLKYYESDEINMRAVSDSYWSIVMSHDIAGRIAWCANILISMAGPSPPPKQTTGRGRPASKQTKQTNPPMSRRHTASSDIQLAALAARIASIKLPIVLTTPVNNECECGGKLESMYRISDRICMSCGGLAAGVGILTDDIIEGYSMGSKKQKNSGHDTSRHWRLWVQRVQASEKYETPEIVKEVVRNGFLSQGIREASRMHCCLIRMYLKNAGLTVHNDHVPSIRKEVCGIVPPQLTYEENCRSELIFCRACEIYMEIKPPDANNNPYYPYYMRKIWECILPDGDRKNRMIDCIHLQGHDTLVKNDRQWEQICERLGDPAIVYRPTNRIEYRVM